MGSLDPAAIPSPLSNPNALSHSDRSAPRHTVMVAAVTVIGQRKAFEKSSEMNRSVVRIFLHKLPSDFPARLGWFSRNSLKAALGYGRHRRQHKRVVAVGRRRSILCRAEIGSSGW
jgi:hypothetical protein